MKRKYDVTAVIGKYIDRESGKEKNRYLTVGAVLERDDGSLCMKLDCLPYTPGEGWFNFYAPKPKDEAPSVPTPSTPRTVSAPPPAAPFEDEIPF